jgi:hypothetical protein
MDSKIPKRLTSSMKMTSHSIGQSKSSGGGSCFAERHWRNLRWKSKSDELNFFSFLRSDRFQFKQLSHDRPFTT